MSVQLVHLLNPINMTISGTFTPKGAYNAGTDYAVGDQVDYNGSSYIMYADAAAGTVPTNTSYWGLVASKGDTGATGEQGIQGDPGVVQSINGYAQAVVTLTPDDLDDTTTTNKFVTAADITKLSNLSGTNTGDQDLSTYQLKPSEGAFANGDKTKLDGIEALSDVTDATNVAAAGAIMDGDITGNGLMTRTAAGTYTNRTITGTTNQVTVTNGDGVGGNPTLSLPQNIHTGASPTFAGVTVTDDAYGAGWNGSSSVPTKNAIYDKIETISGGTGEPSSDYFILAKSDAGAAGDGSTDDTTALQGALNSLNAAGGGALDLEGYTYVTQKLSVYPSTGIINGRLKLKDTTNDYVIAFVKSATRYNERWFLDNVYIDCNAANNSTTAGGVYCVTDGYIFDRPLIRNTKIVNFKTYGIRFDDDGTYPLIQPRLTSVTIDGQDATSGAAGILLSDKVYDASFVSVDVGRSYVGIEVNGSAKTRFTDVRVWGNESVGLKLTSVVDFVAINFEADKNFGHGVYAYSTSRTHFEASAFSNNSYDDASNEFGFGAGHGTANTYDGLVADTSADIYITGCTFMNEGTAYQRYGITSQNSSTVNFDGQCVFDNMATGNHTGTVTNAKKLYELNFNNDFKFQAETTTRTNVGYSSSVGAGMEMYKQTDGSNPGDYKFIYGGGASGDVDFIYSNGSGGFTTQLSLDKNGVMAVGGAITSAGVAIPTISSTSTLTNKRITPRTGTTTSSATPTINTDNVDFYSLTAQAVDITSFTTNLSGTPAEGQKLWIAITGTAARAITWGASFEASTVALPATTVSTDRLDIGFVWNSATSKWRCVAAG